jgi:glucosyl-dolichyl phosphate glucuronosyltransferase
MPPVGFCMKCQETAGELQLIVTTVTEKAKLSSRNHMSNVSHKNNGMIPGSNPADKSMRVTVAICTHNRSQLLDETLARMVEMRIPPGLSWELLVVLNACTDTSRQVAESYSRSLPVTALEDPVPGLSHARNQAVSNAGGDYLIWTDDDVLVSAEWLEAYTAMFSLHPDSSIFGGPIHPLFPGRPPQWLVHVYLNVSVAFALRDLGSLAIPLDPSSGAIPLGANYAIRTAEQRRFLYDLRLGRTPTSLNGGEEVSVMKSMLLAGHTGWWVPDAIVQHYIPSHRQTLSYLRSYYYAAGKNNRSENSNGARRSQNWVWRAALQNEFYYRINKSLRSPAVWIEYLKNASYWWGTLGVETFCRYQPAAGGSLN